MHRIFQRLSLSELGKVKAAGKITGTPPVTMLQLGSLTAICPLAKGQPLTNIQFFYTPEGVVHQGCVKTGASNQQPSICHRTRGYGISKD